MTTPAYVQQLLAGLRVPPPAASSEEQFMAGLRLLYQLRELLAMVRPEEQEEMLAECERLIRELREATPTP